VGGANRRTTNRMWEEQIEEQLTQLKNASKDKCTCLIFEQQNVEPFKFTKHANTCLDELTKIQCLQTLRSLQ